jgi:hypothetical protein
MVTQNKAIRPQSTMVSFFSLEKHEFDSKKNHNL